MKLKQEVEKKLPEFTNRKGVVFHHDYAKPHTSLATQQILREFAPRTNRANRAKKKEASGLVPGARLRVDLIIRTSRENRSDSNEARGRRPAACPPAPSPAPLEPRALAASARITRGFVFPPLGA
ncbi:hypothetical protein EVAR_86772_1 [Eumeta japonica]|uniref:Histone-lysine N-methyltransferase SETMAR n=1 Tax=Eumeta variegata TaxID=151549 RepID=A0A4C1VZT5_EUMVA|nr:hypothetical protein EVAR_86772_1 [Eumeta japonica]